MESNEDLRAELKAAIANVTRQMEIQDNSYPLKGVGAGESNARLVAELAAERAQLEEALEGLGQETEKATTEPPPSLRKLNPSRLVAGC